MHDRNPRADTRCHHCCPPVRTCDTLFNTDGKVIRSRHTAQYRVFVNNVSAPKCVPSWEFPLHSWTWDWMAFVSESFLSSYVSIDLSQIWLYTNIYGRFKENALIQLRAVIAVILLKDALYQSSFVTLACTEVRGGNETKAAEWKCSNIFTFTWHAPALLLPAVLFSAARSALSTPV